MNPELEDVNAYDVAMIIASYQPEHAHLPHALKSVQEAYFHARIGLRRALDASKAPQHPHRNIYDLIREYYQENSTEPVTDEAIRLGIMRMMLAVEAGMQGLECSVRREISELKDVVPKLLQLESERRAA